MKKLLGLFVDNLVYKISAGVLACLFWYIVQAEEVLTIYRRIAVTVEVPEGMAIAGDSVIYRNSTLRASRAMLSDFPDKDIEAKIAISASEPKSYRFRLNRDHIQGLDHRIAIDIHEPNIVVNVDKVVTRSIRIKEVFKGAVDEGFAVSKVEHVPAKVSVTGPEMEVMNLQNIATEPLDLDGVNGQKTYERVNLDKGSRSLTLSPATITTKLQVTERVENKQFAGVKVLGQGSDYLTVISPDFVAIEIQGTKSVLSAVNPKGDLRAYVELYDLRPGKYEREVKARIPPGTVFVGTNPAKVTVEVVSRTR